MHSFRKRIFRILEEQRDALENAGKTSSYEATMDEFNRE